MPGLSGCSLFAFIVDPISLLRAQYQLSWVQWQLMVGASSYSHLIWATNWVDCEALRRDPKIMVGDIGSQGLSRSTIN